MSKKIKSLRYLLIALALCSALNAFSQNIYTPRQCYDNWKFKADELNSVGKLIFVAGQKRTINMEVSIWRFLAAGGGWESTNFTFKMVRYPKGSNTAYKVISNELSIGAEQFNSTLNPRASANHTTVDFNIHLISVSTPAPKPGDIVEEYNKLINNEDRVGIIIKDDSHPNGWYPMTDLVNVEVNGLIKNPGILNNKICCGQCILAGDIPEALMQDPAKVLSGVTTGSRVVWEFTPEGHENPGYITDATWQTCSPHPTNHTVTYKRLLEAYRVDDPTSLNPLGFLVHGLWLKKTPEVWTGQGSNSIRIEVSSLKTARTFSAKNYTQVATEKAGTITIQGNQKLTNLSLGSVDFIAARQIVLLPGTTIYPNINLFIDPSIIVCGSSSGRESTVLDSLEIKTTFVSANETAGHGEASTATTVDNSEYAVNLLTYPNPTSGETMVKYNVVTNGVVRLSIMDGSGKSILNLVDGIYKARGGYQITFNAKALPAGAYYCKFFSNGVTETRKIIVINQSKD